MNEKSVDISTLLSQVRDGDERAKGTLFALLYRDLHLRAQNFMSSHPKDHTLGPTALVHEVYLKLFPRSDVAWGSRQHFLAVATRAMRSILVDHARFKGRLKRQPSGERVPLDVLVAQLEGDSLSLLELDEVLDDFESHDERASSVLHLRLFGQLPMAEISGVLGIPKRTVERDWSYAQAWLSDRLT